MLRFVNFMLIYVNITDRQTDGQTNTGSVKFHINLFQFISIHILVHVRN